MAQSVSSRPTDIISEEDEFDLDDVDFEEALAVLQEAEASSSGTRVSSAQAPSNSHSKGVTNAHASVARPPPAGRMHAQSNARPAQSASTGPQQRAQTSLVIDIDDSDDDDEEVALMLISEGSQEGRTRKTELGSRGRRTNQPIEID